MLREQKTQAIVLKKTAFGEADELITFYTEEYGKVRAVAASVKKSTSKLQHALQQLSLVHVQLTTGSGGRIPKIIGAQLVDVFMHVRESQEKIKAVLVAIELVLIATPDEQPSAVLFKILKDFLLTLNTLQAQPNVVLVKFKMQALEALGFAVQRLLPGLAESSVIGFSARGGGFVEVNRYPEAEVITWSQYRLFLSIYNKDFFDLEVIQDSVSELDQLLSGFIGFQLERELKTEK